MAHDRVALVTGSGKRRVGNTIARDLAAHGFRIAIHYHRSRDAAEATVDELRRGGTDAVALQGDLTHESSVRKVIEGVVEHFGRLDVLVCAAAIWKRTPFADVTAEAFREHWEANALATFLCCLHAGRVMVGQPTGGCLVTIGDWATIRPYRDYLAYFPSKGEIPTLTRAFAVELATQNPNIRVNCVLPGPVMLPPELDEAERHEAIAATLVKREGSPEHVAHAVRFFVENDFVTGVCLPVDGGRSIFA